ncbi:uncharacterized protein LOC126783955 [Argentina anserina]|uniref:uncharacterized protein LOC126783955 n=1 Tax=Argentina anserina TaxID=57926 RepID=UPI0021765ED1|nr:uncharacterized protein LOC126783955 [Potentilla anserina]
MSASGSNSANASASATLSIKRDGAWQWTAPIPGHLTYFLCSFCNQRCTGGISRFKQHLVGSRKGIRACPKVPPNVKSWFIETLKTNEVGKFAKIALRREIEGLPLQEEDDAEVQNTVVSEKCGLAFNVANNPYYFAACEQIAKFGPGFKPPSSHELRTWILKEEVMDVQKLMVVHKKDWSQYGCTIMSDGWMDGKSRVILKFLVNSPKGTWFLKSVDALDTMKNGELMLKYLDDVVEEIGEENVIQIVTDNASKKNL